MTNVHRISTSNMGHKISRLAIQKLNISCALCAGALSCWNV